VLLFLEEEGGTLCRVTSRRREEEDSRTAAAQEGSHHRERSNRPTSTKTGCRTTQTSAHKTRVYLRTPAAQWETSTETGCRTTQTSAHKTRVYLRTPAAQWETPTGCRTPHRRTKYRSVKPVTYQGYERMVRNHLVPTLERIKLKALTPAHLRLHAALGIDQVGIAVGDVIGAFDLGLHRSYLLLEVQRLALIL
jgi:hypothetical protein